MKIVIQQQTFEVPERPEGDSDVYEQYKFDDILEEAMEHRGPVFSAILEKELYHAFAVAYAKLHMVGTAALKIEVTP